MASVGEALLAALGGDGPATPYSAAHALVAEHGSISAAARAAGVSRSTFRGWLAGRTPRGGGGWLVELGRFAHRARAMHPGRARRLTGQGVSAIRVTGTFNYAGGGAMRGNEDRDVPLGDWLRDDTLDELIEAYLEGADADELAEILHDGITDGGFYRDTFDPNNPQGGWDITHIDGLD